MPYTPPAGGGINVELGIPVSYTPPLGGVLAFDLALAEGASGQSTFVTAMGASLVPYAPASQTVAFAAPSLGLTLTAYAPASHSIFLNTQIAAPFGLTITAYAPTYVSQKVSAVEAFAGALTMWGIAGQFLGINQPVTSPAPMTLTAWPVTGSAQTVTVVPELALNVSIPLPTQVLSHAVTGAAGMSLALHSVTFKKVVKSPIIGKYSYPSITLDVSGDLTLAMPADVAQVYKVRAGILSAYFIARVVSGFIDARYSARFGQAFASSYSIYGPVRAEAVSEYRVRATDPVRVAIGSDYAYTVASAVQGRYAILANTRIHSAVTAYYSTHANTRVSGFLRGVYSAPANSKVRLSIPSPYSFQLSAVKSVGSVYSMTMPAVAGVSSPYTLTSTQTVVRAVMGVYTGRDETTQLISSAPTVSVGGVSVGIIEAEVGQAEGEFLWRATLVLEHVADYIAFAKDQPFTVTFGSEVFAFIMDTKELSRNSPAGVHAIVTGFSPAAVYDFPRADALDYIWENPTTASAAASMAIPGIDWGVLDWTIPPYRLAASGASPVSVVATLAAAIGATVEAAPDGSVHVRSLYPVSVRSFETTAPAHVFLESLDILSVGETYPSEKAYNRISVSDIEGDVSDSLEWIPSYDGAWVGTVRAYLFPWRTGVTLEHTGRSTTYIDPPAIFTEKHEEILEVFQGSGSTQYPIYSVESVDYEATNVGGLIFDTDSRQFTVTGSAANGVIKIVYWSRSLDYPVGIVEGAPTQFLLRSNPL